MALHPDELSMLRESLPEYLCLAELGLTTRKPNGGAHGYAAATLLMCIVDAIGSYHRDDPGFLVLIDGKQVGIREPRQHFRVLNSPYFGLALRGEEVNSIYELCRSPLAHNALVARGHAIALRDKAGPPFTFAAGQVETNLPALHARCVHAVELFLPSASAVVMTSAVVADLQQKSSARGATPPGGQ